MRANDIPRKPMLTLNIGVTGHRPNKLGNGVAAELQKETEQLLLRLYRWMDDTPHRRADLYSPAPSRLRVISALAEGADRLVAIAALRQRCELTAILPFARNTYCSDFAEQASRDEFLNLLQSASTVIELDGRYKPPALRDKAYGAVGLNVVRHADVLLAIWDGCDAVGHGGTAEVVNYAVSSAQPVIWFVSDVGPSKRYGDRMRLLLRDRSVLIGAEAELYRELTRALVPAFEPSGHGSGLNKTTRRAGSGLLAAYFAETAPRWRLYRLFDLFQKAVITLGHRHPPRIVPPGGTATATPTVAESFVAGVEREWAAQLSEVSGAAGFADPSLSRLAGHYAWLDRLSTYYAGLYRTTYLINYLLAAGAVFAAATFTRIGVVFELIILVGILLLTYIGTVRNWHGRWIDYRDLAERLRAARYLRVVAGPPASPSAATVRPLQGTSEAAWLNDAITRECGLPSIIFGAGYFERVRRYLIASEVSDQIGYHHRNSERLHVFDHRLHLISMGSFAAAIVVAVLHFAAEYPPLEEYAALLPVLGYASIILPSLGAALYGIRNQGEFSRVAERSKRMEQTLKGIRDDLEQSAGTIADREALEAKVRVLAETMLSETSDWQSLFRAKPLELPG